MIKVLQENDKVLIFSNLVVFIRANESVIVLVCNCVYFEGVVFVFCFKGGKGKLGHVCNVHVNILFVCEGL